jgi:hypothetical protein
MSGCDPVVDFDFNHPNNQIARSLTAGDFATGNGGDPLNGSPTSKTMEPEK